MKRRSVTEPAGQHLRATGGLRCVREIRCFLSLSPMAAVISMWPESTGSSRPIQSIRVSVSRLLARHRLQKRPVQKPARAASGQAPVVKATRQTQPGANPLNIHLLNGSGRQRAELFAPIRPRHRVKKGIGITGERGQAVRAAGGGKVVYSGNGLIGYGNLIILKHNETYLSAYAHSLKVLVKEGQTVKQGQKVATMGLNENGTPMLHFEIRRNGKPVNPVGYLPRR